MHRTVAAKPCISDPMLVKPKCVWEVADFLKNCKQTAVKCKQIFENWKNLPPLKHILALLTWTQKWTITVQQPLELTNFQTKRPVCFKCREYAIYSTSMLTTFSTLIVRFLISTDLAFDVNPI